MSRFKVLRANPRRTLAALATLLIAVGVTAASGASFTAQSANPGNSIASGTLKMSNSANNAAFLTVSNLKPAGPTQFGEVQLSNTGSLSGAFTVKKANLADSTPPMAGNLDLTIEECGADLNCAAGTGLNASSTVWTGKLSAMPTQALGTWANGDTHRYRFTVGLDSAADDTLQGKTTTVDFVWDAA